MRRSFVVLMGAGLLVVGACTKADDPAASGNGPAASGVSGGTGVATTGAGGKSKVGQIVSLGLGQDTEAQVARAGLEMLPQEELDLHYHAHLDVQVHAAAVTVPAQIGISASAISPLHTHDTDGVIHIEAADQGARGSFRLDQVFTEWGVKFDNSCLATYCSDATNELRVYVNGTQVEDVLTVALEDQQAIFVYFGPKSATPSVPDSWSQ